MSKQRVQLVVTVAYVGAMWWILTPEWRRMPLLWWASSRALQRTAGVLGHLGLVAERNYFRCVR